ncbi:MAG: hypothetical protein IPJ81_08655 [Chitinophagaceae bacterium]|nr:hypothetical protein [Chitinophagaceae bacterium]
MSSERTRIIQNLIQLNQSIHYLSPGLTTINRYKYKLKLASVKEIKTYFKSCYLKPSTA